MARAGDEPRRYARAMFATERLLARPWTLDDAEGAHAMYGDPEVVRYIGNDLRESVDSTRELLGLILERAPTLPKGMGSFPLVLRATGEIVGAGARHGGRLPLRRQIRIPDAAQAQLRHGVGRNVEIGLLRRPRPLRARQRATFESINPLLMIDRLYLFGILCIPWILNLIL